MRLDELQKSLLDKEPRVHVEKGSTSIPVTPSNWSMIAQVLGITRKVHSMCNLLGELTRAQGVVQDNGDVHTVTMPDIGFTLLIPHLAVTE